MCEQSNFFPSVVFPYYQYECCTHCKAHNSQYSSPSCIPLDSPKSPVRKLKQKDKPKQYHGSRKTKPQKVAFYLHYPLSGHVQNHKILPHGCQKEQSYKFIKNAIFPCLVPQTKFKNPLKSRASQHHPLSKCVMTRHLYASRQTDKPYS